MPRPKGSAELIEARRRQSLRLLDEGYSLNEVGRMVGCTPSSVIRWRDALRAGGEAGLKVRTAPGRPPTLAARQRVRVVKRLLRGAMANGFGAEVWTCARVAILIQRQCRVRFHRSHVARLLHDLGINCQKPERRAVERDDLRVGERKRKGWPRIKRTLRGRGPTLPLPMIRAS